MPELQFDDASGALWAEQEIGSVADYTLSFAPDLQPGDRITGVTATVTQPADDTTLDVSRKAFTDSAATVWVGAGASNTWYLVRIRVTTDGGSAFVKSFRVLVNDPAALGVDVRSVFSDLTGAIMSLRRDRLLSAAGAYFPDLKLSDAFLLEKLTAAESQMEQDLRIYFHPHEMIPETAPQAEADALVTAGQIVSREPGYDYDPALFQGNSWGLVVVRETPIIKVNSIVFNYPAPTDTLFTIPNEWIRFDPKIGLINLVPVQTAISLPLNAFILSALGGGRRVPLMLQVRYRAGLENVETAYPNITDAIKKSAVLSIIGDQWLPQSGSTSADGLSQSVSFDLEKYRKTISDTINDMRDFLHGIRMAVL